MSFTREQSLTSEEFAGALLEHRNTADDYRGPSNKLVFSIYEALEAHRLDPSLHSDLVVHKDDRLLVLNKPRGVITERNHEAGYPVGLADAVQQVYPTAIHVHRLDIEASGLIFFSLDEEAHNFLSNQFIDKSERAFRASNLTETDADWVMSKVYLAIVEGALTEGMDLQLRMAKDPSNPRKMTVVDDESQPAKMTRTVVMPYGYDAKKNITLCRVELHTGLQNQIRVALASVGHPIVGDGVYGSTSHLARKTMLHAWKARILHPEKRDTRTFIAPRPKDMEAIIQSMRT